VPCAFTQDVPIEASFYERIVEGLGNEPTWRLHDLRVACGTSTCGKPRRIGTGLPRSAYILLCMAY
jgi:hypothetical protein